MLFIWKAEYRSWYDTPVILEEVWTKMRLIVRVPHSEVNVSSGKRSRGGQRRCPSPEPFAAHGTLDASRSFCPACDRYTAWGSRLCTDTALSISVVWYCQTLPAQSVLQEHMFLHQGFGDSRWLVIKECQRQKGWGCCCFKSESL